MYIINFEGARSGQTVSAYAFSRLSHLAVAFREARLIPFDENYNELSKRQGCNGWFIGHLRYASPYPRPLIGDALEQAHSFLADMHAAIDTYRGKLAGSLSILQHAQVRPFAKNEMAKAFRYWYYRTLQAAVVSARSYTIYADRKIAQRTPGWMGIHIVCSFSIQQLRNVHEEFCNIRLGQTAGLTSCQSTCLIPFPA